MLSLEMKGGKKKETISFVIHDEEQNEWGEFSREIILEILYFSFGIKLLTTHFKWKILAEALLFN